MPLPVIFTVALAVTALVAVRFGSQAAKRMSLAYLAVQLIALFSQRGFYHVQIWYPVLDLLLLLGTTWITLRARQTWPIACATLQFVTVLGHVARLAVPRLWPLAYFIMVQWTAWPFLATILIGMWLDWRAGRISPEY